jgi:cell wall-associated NlpC family hydrolase
MLDNYLMSDYLDGGRGEVVSGRRQFDCWGLVRSVRHEVFGLPLLPSYGDVAADDKRSLTRAAEIESGALTLGAAVPAAIATVWKAGLCVHVGICVELDGRLGVLDTGPELGAIWAAVPVFERRYLKVRYYR